jgi:hypothetical protein
VVFYRLVNSSAVCGLLIVVAFGAANVSAQTVGYWRFESGGFLDDSSGNGHHLTANTGSASQVAAPANFLNPVPPVGGGLSNNMAVSVPGAG